MIMRFIPRQSVSVRSASGFIDGDSRTGSATNSKQQNRTRAALASLVFCAAMVGMSATATAERICRSATSLVSLGGSPGFEFKGLRVQADGDLFADFQLPDGQNICSFRLKFRDNDSTNNVTATLERKGVADGGNATANPQVMGKVASSGAKVRIRSKVDSSIANPLIDSDNFTYYVRVSLPPGNTIELIQVCITVGLTCP